MESKNKDTVPNKQSSPYEELYGTTGEENKEGLGHEPQPLADAGDFGSATRKPGPESGSADESAEADEKTEEA